MHFRISVMREVASNFVRRAVPGWLYLGGGAISHSGIVGRVVPMGWRCWPTTLIKRNSFTGAERQACSHGQNIWGRLKTTLIYHLFLIITLHFTCGKWKIWLNMKKSQNIKTMIVGKYCTRACQEICF